MHWTSVAMAIHIGISIRSVQRIWRTHGLQPYMVRPHSSQPQCAGRYGDRTLHAASSASGVIRFLNVTEAARPKGKVIHAIVDNYATHKHPKVQAWLARHPR
jgi:hypothetical protein